MKSLVLVSALLALAAWADELPPDACIGTLEAGDACSTDDGTSGMCVEKRFEYVENGVTHGWSELLCVPTVSAPQRSMLPWFGAGLAFLSLCVGVATTRRPRLEILA